MLTLFDRYGQPASLCDHWKNVTAFLVGGGPSYRQVAYQRLAERGVASLGVNNVAGDVPCSAFVCSDPPRKFHHGIWLDPKVLKLVPDPKRTGYRAKLRAKVDGSFKYLKMTTAECPSTYFFQRGLQFEPSQFFHDPGAFWGVNETAVTRSKRPKILFTFFVGLRMLHYLGVRRVYLLGVDFGMGPQQAYGFAQGKAAGGCASNNATYRVALEMLRELKPYIAREGMEVYNTNRESQCNVFDWVPFEVALQDCKGGVPSDPFDLADWYQTDEWVRGRDAFLAGDSIDSCPYQPHRKHGDANIAEWKTGWRAGENGAK